MTLIVDPTNVNEAILDGRRAVAVRLIPADQIRNPAAPLLSELEGGTIIGYSADFFPFGARS